MAHASIQKYIHKWCIKVWQITTHYPPTNIYNFYLLHSLFTGIQRDKQDTEDKDLLIIVLFDKDFTNSDSLDPLCKRMHRLHPQGLINISHGERLANKSSAPKSHMNAVADKSEYPLIDLMDSSQRYLFTQNKIFSLKLSYWLSG